MTRRHYFEVRKMDDILPVVLITVAAMVALKVVLLLVLSGGDTGRIVLATRAGLRMLRDAELAGKVDKLLNPLPPGPVKPSGEAVRLFALLQREGRLLDFLLEDIQALPDDQVGAGVRDIHRQCQHALKEHVVLEPVLPQKESDNVEVPPGFDPSAIRLTGNVTGQPPFKGVLRHHGWRVKELKIAKPPEAHDELVLQPAEVELV
jgi:hypothetical protein